MSFSLSSTDRSNGKPLAGVRITLRDLWSRQRYDLVGGADGVASIQGVIPGRYEVVLTHDTHAPLWGAGPRARTIRLPASPVSCQWAEVHVAGWKAVGSDSLAALGRVRYSDVPSFEQTGELRREDFEEIVDRLRARWGDYIHACVPKPDTPKSTTVTIFDENKGPCQFDLPLVPLSEFRERTVCDLSGKPVVEAMSRLKIEVVDAAGTPLDIGRIKIERESASFGYREDHLFGNTPHLVPPGRYEVSASDLDYPWQLPAQIIELLPGKSAVARLRLPHRMREVVLIVPGTGGLAQIVDGEARGKRISIRSRHRLWLPQSAVSLELLCVPEGARKLVRIERELTVAATGGVQRITVPVE